MGNHNSGRKQERYCKRGHDKYATGGTYILKSSTGSYYSACAVCIREYRKRKWATRHR